jgi:hypothetical protein
MKFFFVNFVLYFCYLIKKNSMALIPNNKKKKDGKPAAAKSNIPGFPNGKNKTSKGAVKNTRFTGGAQRGS